MTWRRVSLAVTILLTLTTASQSVFAATGAPRILNYQGRLMDSSGNVLGGSGTNYCFRFALYDNPVAGSGTKLWPTATPSTMTISVKNGVFNAGVGDTGAGGDTLDYNFQDSDTVYLNVDVATMVGPTCASGDGAESYESLSPRQRLYSSAYTVNANTVGGFAPAQNATGNQIPVLASGNLVLGGVNPIISATTTNALTVQGNSTGDIRFFNANNRLNSSGNLALAGSLFLANGTATSTLQSSLTGTSTIQGFLNVLGGVNSTSTFSGGLSVNSFNVAGNATSTFANGLSLSSGCFAVNGTCISAGFATSTADFYTNASTTIAKTYSSNSFTATQTFINASTTNFSATYASSTQGFFGSLFVGSLNGILRATAGAVATSLVNLASDVTGFLGVVNGGTGTSTAPALGQVLVGNASGGYDLVATSTFGAFSTTSANYYVDASSTIPKTYTSNIFNGTQRFNNASSTLLSVFNKAYFGGSATTTIDFNGSLNVAGILSASSTATSTFANGVNIFNGCFAVKGTCINNSASSSNVVLSAVRTGNATTSWAVPNNLVYAVVELWGGGGGGGGGGTTGANGGTGGTSNFGGLATSSGGVGGVAQAGVTLRGAGGAGGTGAGGAVNMSGGAGTNATTTIAGPGGSAPRGGQGAPGILAAAIMNGNPGGTFGGGGGGAGNATAGRLGGGGGGGGYAEKVFTASQLTGTTSVQVAVGAAGVGGLGAGTAPSNGGAGGAGGYIIYEYTASNVTSGNGSVSSGTTGQVAFYDANGTVVSGTSVLYVDTPNGRIGISSTTPGAELAVAGSAIVTGRITTSDIVATGTLTVSGKTTLANASTTNISASYASSTLGVFGSAVIGTLSGIVHATAGAISASALNLATEVTGFLGIANGGTGTSTAPALGQVLVGNATGGYDLVATSTFGTFSTTSANAYMAASSTIPKTYTANNFTALQTFGNASTTNISASYASSTLGVFGSAVIGSLTGILRATAGTVSSSLVNLASDVTGFLGIANGGTGTSTAPALGQVLVGNATGGYDLVATSTFGTFSTTSANAYMAASSTIPKTYTANNFTALQTFGNASTTNISASYASSTLGVFGSAVIGSLSGILKATAGVVSNSLVNLASDVTGFLGIANGGTGTSTAPAPGQVLVGNASGGYDLVATSTFGTFSTTSANYYVDASTTIPKTYASNIFNGKQTFTNASSTNFSSFYASSTQGFFGSLSVGNFNGILKATGGAISTSLVNLTSDVTNILSPANGGTGWASLAANTLLTGNDAGQIATTTVGSGLSLGGGTLSLNVANANIWSGLQTFGNASTSVQSVFTKAYFGGTATTTIDSAGNVSVAGTLAVTGNTTLGNATSTNLLVTASSSINKLSTWQATTTALYVSSSLMGAGLTACANTTDKLLWNSASGQFSCGTDAGAGTGISNLGAPGQQQNGASQTFATSTDPNIGLVITSALNVHTFTTIWNGILSVARGGTGWANIAANTLLTGNGSGAVATTTVGTTLQLSGGSLDLDLSNVNVWSGLQTFGSASSTQFESMREFARSIQSTSTNALVFKTNLTSTAGLTLGGTTTTMVSLDTQNNRINLGTGGSGNPTTLVMDTGNSSDPAGTPGAMYYSSTYGTFRCYEGSAWRSCGGQATSTTGDIQFKNSDGAFKATPNFNWSLASNGLTIKGNSGQTADLLSIASSTGTTMFSVSSMGVLELATTTDPATPPAGQLSVYAKEIAGRVLPKWIAPSGVDTPFQASLGFNKISFVSSAGATLTALGAALTNVGTLAASALSTASLKQSVRRTTLTSAGTAQALASSRVSALMVTRGNAPGIGGLFYTARFGLTTLQAGNRAFFGLADSVGIPINQDPTASTTPGKVGMAINTNSGNWKFVWNVTGSAPTVSDLGASFPVDTTSLYELILYSPPNGSAITWRVTNLSTGAQISSTTATTNIPANTTFLAPIEWMTNNTTAAAVAFDLVGWYLESDE